MGNIFALKYFGSKCTELEIVTIIFKLKLTEMSLKFIVVLILLNCCLIGCKSKTTKAVIIERKRINDSSTSIIYSYNLNGKSVVDSQLITNTIFSKDTIDYKMVNDSMVLMP